VAGKSEGEDLRWTEKGLGGGKGIGILEKRSMTSSRDIIDGEKNRWEKPYWTKTRKKGAENHQCRLGMGQWSIPKKLFVTGRCRCTWKGPFSKDWTVKLSSN